jgi:hypothetical protein
MIRAQRIAIAALAALALAAPAIGQITAQSPTQRDGAHDMDFDFGTWKTHSSRLLHPLTGSNDWVDMDGSTIVSPIWGGRGNLAEFKGAGSAGVIELLALRLYSPKTAGSNSTIRRTTRGARSCCASLSGGSPRTPPSPSRPFPLTAARPGRPTGSIVTPG